MVWVVWALIFLCIWFALNLVFFAESRRTIWPRSTEDPKYLEDVLQDCSALLWSRNRVSGYGSYGLWVRESGDSWRIRGRHAKAFVEEAWFRQAEQALGRVKFHPGKSYWFHKGAWLELEPMEDKVSSRLTDRGGSTVRLSLYARRRGDFVSYSIYAERVEMSGLELLCHLVTHA